MDPAQIERGSRSAPSLPTALEATRRFTGWNKAGKQCACAVQQTRSPVSAAGSLTFGSRCLFPSGVTLIFRVSVTGLSTPPFRRLFSLPLFFFPLSFCSSPPPAFHARAGLALGSRLSAACPPELGLAVPRAAPTSACSGGSSGLGACWRAVPLGPARPFGVDAGEFRDFGGDAGVQAQVPGRARATFLKLALCFARESLALSRGSPD